MTNQIHRRFTDDQVKLLLELYNKGAIPLEQVLRQLEISRSRFYQILKAYRCDPEAFTIAYARDYPQHCISKEVEQKIREELETHRQLIGDKQTPLWRYNYAAVRDEVAKHLGCRLSAQTVRNRAKKWGFYIPSVKKEKCPPREVVTDAVGMLLQHDSSNHKWSPYTDKKWTLITTLDDYSLYLLYADFVEKETAWAHIRALESVILTYGVGLVYYVDNHSIFRFVSHMDSIWQRQVKRTDEVLIQWKRVVQKCGMQVWHTLSAQAKGKIERPYRWLQDRIVRRCACEHVEEISQGRVVLQQELHRYNTEQVHSATGEIPVIRLQKAVMEGRTFLSLLSCYLPISQPKTFSVCTSPEKSMAITRSPGMVQSLPYRSHYLKALRWSFISYHRLIEWK